VEGSIFQYDFILKGLLGAIFASITAGIIGTYIVTRKMVFLSGGITHASFGGIGIGYYAGINPVVGAAIFGVLSALGIEYLSLHHRIREDSAIGILWAFGMAVGIIFIYLTPGYSPNLRSPTNQDRRRARIPHPITAGCPSPPGRKLALLPKLRCHNPTLV